jgi:acyl-CoA hydrolase
MDLQLHCLNVLCRLVMPADTQFLGIVHGGVMMTLMEEAGELHTTRFCSLFGCTVRQKSCCCQ